MISSSADQPQDRERVQFQVIDKKSTSSKLKASTTVIFRNLIVKNLHNIITKSVKHKKHVKYISGGNIADMKHYKNPTQEKSVAEIIIHVGTNDLSSDKESKDNSKRYYTTC